MNTRSSSPGHLALQRFLRNRTAVSGLVFLLLATAVSVLAPWVMATDPNQGSESPFVSPGASHWMGTDIHGRDLFSRVLVGTRISLLVGAVGAGVSVLIGVSWGLVSGWRGGRTDAWMMRLVDVLYALPTVVWVMLTLTIFETRCVGWLSERWPASIPAFRLAAMMVSLGSVSWLTMARVVRAQVLSLRERPFILAAQSIGVSPVRLMLRHFLPHLAGVVIVYLTLTVPAVVLYESF